MTEKEAAAFAQKLERIWSLECDASHGVTWTIYEDVEATTFWTLITGEIQLFCDDEFNFDGVQRQRIFRLMQGTGTTGYLRFPIETGKISNANRTPTQIALCEQFATEWMPFFRRGCWLSGCAIEASAHEKAEWMQGFKHEELEAWNLNF